MWVTATCQMCRQSSRRAQHHCASASAEPERPPGVTCIEGGGSAMGHGRIRRGRGRRSAHRAHHTRRRGRSCTRTADGQRTEPSSSCRASLLSEQPCSAATIGSASFAPRTRRGDRHRDVALLRGQHRGQHRRRRRQIGGYTPLTGSISKICILDEKNHIAPPTELAGTARDRWNHRNQLRPRKLEAAAKLALVSVTRGCIDN